MYSIVSPARAEPGFVRLAYVFCSATVRAVMVAEASGSLGSLVIVCGLGKLGFALVHVPAAVAAFVITAVPPVPSGITSALLASFCGT